MSISSYDIAHGFTAPMTEVSPRFINTRACDACRLRRKKCERAEHQPKACIRCENLKIACTFNELPKTRGRKRGSHHTDAVVASRTFNSPTQSPVTLRPRLYACEPAFPSSSDPDVHLVFLSSPVSSWGSLETPQGNNLSFQAVGNGSQGYPTDDLCSRDLLTLILDDYLRLLYPLVPLVHRPSFIADLQNVRDARDQDFHGLLVGLCAMVVANIPTRFRLYQRHDSMLRFQSRRAMVDHCFNTIMRNRNPDYFDRLNHLKWAIAYSMRIAFYHIGEHNRTRFMDVESMQIARLLYFHDISEYSGLNCIETQLRKKAFWLNFYSYVHNQLQSLRKERLSYIDPDILETIKLDDMLPLEVDDEMIFRDSCDPQPSSDLSTVSGFIIHSRVFWAALRSTNQPLTVSPDEEQCYCYRVKHPRMHLLHLKDRFREMKYMLDRIPSRLRQWIPIAAKPDQSDQSFKAAAFESQFAIMRGNLHSTHLWLQNILLDQLDALIGDEASNLQDTFPYTHSSIWAEREELSRQLLHVLHSIPLQHLEPNGLNITEKIRDVAVSLLSCPYGPEDERAQRATQYVREFTEIISKFELDPVHTSNTQSWIDTDRLAPLQQSSDTLTAASTSWA